MDILGKSGLGLELAKQLAARAQRSGVVVEAQPLNGIGAAAAEIGRLRGVLEEIKRLSRLEDSVRMSAINQLADKALEAKP